MTDNITGKVIVITGASSGMGEATARDLAAKGAKVALGARRADRLEALVKDIKDAGGEAVAVATDVTKLDEVQKLVDTAKEAFGRVDVIFNNAGLMPLSPLESLKIDEWNQMIDVNMKGTLYGIAAVLPIFKEQKSGQVINVSSVYGHKTVATGAVYCATKHAVRSLSEGLRQEVKPYNVRVTVISPGAVDTELTQHISEPELGDNVRDLVKKIAVPATTMADMVAFAISQPENVDVSEILFRPTVQPE
ncbi:NADP-dependent 3-hydroxy acid dehydrogenase YdfG [Rhodobium orientis]|uniref:Oxidoreductase n=1 Tax=Rhodobium orientis TaxID=34017 RepID=A0A327JSC8_9HYPH|nr:SDR family oxidoreductase [Rhodobium orientis]MBB4303486.1 NADP-dependent 3-hydroxy acid dehydrogenase YdfG [Rhodobium orientis]MBK5950419.1 oxidoreductase [Rhodobium orientis]RAI28353.1 oxidoreductase [Rhodobium orientis]